MRTYLLVILLMVVALLSLRMASADTPCTDPTFRNALQSDLKTARYVSDSAEKTFQNSTTAAARRALMQTVVTIIKLRQKYEDMTTLPAACADSRLQATQLFANMTDSLTFDLGQLDDSQRSDSYAQLASAQTSRIDRMAAYVSGAPGGTAVSTTSAALTPGLAASAEAGNPGAAAARCVDGAFWYSTERRGACSNHGGVATWYK